MSLLGKVKGRTEVSHFEPQEQEVRKFMANYVAISEGRRAQLDYEAEYNNRRRVPEHVEINARWQAASAAYRSTARADLDQAYGPGERHRYDLYLAGDPKAPLVVYVHGGYWQRGDRKEYAFLARALNAAGLDVAVPSYSLCPAVLRHGHCRGDPTLSCGPMEEDRQASPRRRTLRGRAPDGGDGGERLEQSCRRARGSGARRGRHQRRVRSPPAHTNQPQRGAALDAQTARAASPLFWPLPPKDRTLVAAVGGAESAEFLRQSRDIVAAWKRAGLACEYLEVPGANHFTVVDELTRPASALFSKVAALARM